MARQFDSNNKSPNPLRIFYRTKWEREVYPENGGIGPKMITDFNFAERLHYGMIDNKNNSIIPNDNYIVSTANGRVFDFVADSYSLMRLNWTSALQRGLASERESAFGALQMVDSYKNPKKRYGEYLDKILRFYNKKHIPNVIGITNITSYESYVNNFFDFLFKNSNNVAITMTRWNTSRHSSIMDSGLAFSYSNIPYDEDQRKVNQIIDHPSFGYFKNLCLNMSFAIDHNRPNILVYDVTSPASVGIRASYGISNLSSLFGTRFIKTYTLDNNLLYNYINIYYNKYALEHPQTKISKVVCGQTVAEYISLSTVSLDKRLYTDLQELELYCKIRNLEEGTPFSEQKVNKIYKKAKYFLKKVDKAKAMGYINEEYRDQVWNKDHGIDDLFKKLEGKTKTQSERDRDGSNRGGSSSY